MPRLFVIIGATLMVGAFSVNAANADIIGCSAESKSQRHSPAIGCDQKIATHDKTRGAHRGNSVATATTTIRARPTTHSARVGTLRKGEHADVIRWEGNWAVVGYKGASGRTTGYVSAGSLRRAR